MKMKNAYNTGIKNVKPNEKCMPECKMCTGTKNVCPNEKCVQERKMYTQNATQSKPSNLMKVVCPDTGHTQINSAP